MGIPVRPSKPTSGAGGVSYLPDKELPADELDADAQTLYDTLSGNIDNANISPTAAIVGTKIASKPNGIDTLQLNTNSVKENELSSDAVTDANRAVGPDHIKNDAVIARILKTTLFQTAPTGSSLAAGDSNDYATGVLSTAVIPLHCRIHATAANRASTSGTNLVLTIWEDSGDNQIYLKLANHGAGPVALDGRWNLILEYVPVS